MQEEKLTLSSGLVKYIQDRSSSELSIRKVSDALSLEVLSDRNLTAFVGLINDYYCSKGLIVADLSSITHEKFALRTYRHKLSTSSVQVMISQKSKYDYHLFINDNEDDKAREIRINDLLLNSIRSQVSNKN